MSKKSQIIAWNRLKTNFFAVFSSFDIGKKLKPVVLFDKYSNQLEWFSYKKGS